MNVLCVVAHPDDEVLGVGGTLARHADRGDDVHVCILSDGVTSRYDESEAELGEKVNRRKTNARQACETLGIKTVSFYKFPDNKFDTVPLLDIVQTIESELEKAAPSRIYTHHYGDLNIDHELTCRAVMTAARPLPDTNIEQILGFETLSSTEWAIPTASNSFQPETFVDISKYLESKVEALRYYEDELRQHPHPRCIKSVQQNGELWGAKAGIAVAEPFELLRMIWR